MALLYQIYTNTRRARHTPQAAQFCVVALRLSLTDYITQMQEDRNIPLNKHNHCIV